MSRPQVKRTLSENADLVNHGNGQAKTEASRQTDKQLPSTGEKTNRGLFVTGLLSILSLGSFENVVQNNK